MGPQTKDDIGTLLFPLVLQWEPKLAEKITGMLLDLPVEDLCHLLVDGHALRAKIHEAMPVLRQALAAADAAGAAAAGALAQSAEAEPPVDVGAAAAAVSAAKTSPNGKHLSHQQLTQQKRAQ